MKKIKAVLAAMVSMAVFTANGAVVQAAEPELTVQAGEVIVTELTADEARLLSAKMTETVLDGEVSLPQAATASYTPYQYSQTFTFYDGSKKAAEATAVCVVWHYTDGKVHLYQRTISVVHTLGYNATRVYGNIKNTDGSYSFTLGDRVYVYGDTSTWIYAIDFYACSSEQHFNCYPVTE